MKNQFPSLYRVYIKLKKYPQLFWTLFVAVFITVGFLIVVQQFINIAEDAQDRLINVRIGSIQDSLTEFVVLDEDSKDQIDSVIENLMIKNSTIREFTFYKKTEDSFEVFASSNKDLVGTLTQDITIATQLSLSDPQNSYTLPFSFNNERMYQTSRALLEDGVVVGYVETIQTLSQADKIIEEKIRNGMIIFIIILSLIMILFFRHSRIIDYTNLYEELKKVDQLKDDFIAMASHELKTPLTTIRGYSECITEAEDVPEQYKECSRRIDASSKQLALLIEDMLEVSRIEQGRITFNIQKILVPDFIKKIIPDFKNLTKEKNLNLLFEHDGLTHPYIQADETRFRQILVNIIGNSIKYTNSGEVKIQITNEKEKLIIRVSDTGIGMSEEERKNLFGKFYRIQNEETRNIRGTGLGLWITKQLIEKMGGSISVESIKGVGTHMILEFKSEV